MSVQPRSQHSSHAMESIQTLGVRLSLMTLPSFLRYVVKVVGAGKKTILGNHNLHSLYLYGTNPEFRAIYDHCDQILIDGMGVILFSTLAGKPIAPIHRLTCLDYTEELMKLAELRKWKVFLLGSSKEASKKALENLRSRYPLLCVEGEDGYFDKRENSIGNRNILKKISTFKPDILLVGLSMPIQEKWIMANYDRLEVPLIAPVGALINSLAGNVVPPPRWMGAIGLEWFFRLIVEPRRLWHRYLIEPWFILHLILKQWFSK